MENIQNAIITNTSITMKDFCCLTFWVYLEGSGWGVGLGGYCIGHGYLGSDDFSAKSGLGLEAMMRIMNVVGVDTWEDLKGKYCRIETEGWGGRVLKIGNILKDEWFDVQKFFGEKEAEK